MKNKPIAQYITALGIAGTVLATLYIGAINPKTGFPEPIVVDGQTIEFTWTDENKNEDLIIYTDKATYTNGIAHADVYVAVENRSGKDQNIELMGYFRDSKQKVTDISVLTEVTTEEPVITTRNDCKQVKATSTCTEIQEQTATTTVTNTVWRKLAQLERTELEKNLEDSKLVEYSRKSVEGFIAQKKSSLFTLPTGKVAYYKVLVEFPAQTDDNFYFEAIGDQGGYGHLDPWFNASWLYRVKLEVVPSKVGTSTAITSFPVYVDLSDLPAGFHSNVKGDGCDIRMVESDNSTETAFELVAYATSTDTGELHFMADALSTTSTSTFYMYYGNSGASCYANTDTYGRNNVWGGYQLVYHLQTASTDSTSNGRNGTDTNITYGAAKIGSGAFNTSKNGKIATASWSLNSAFTAYGWVKLDVITGVQTFFSTYNGSGTGNNTAQGYNAVGGGELYYSNFVVDSGPAGSPNFVANTWGLAHYAHDGTTIRMYLDGAQVDTGTVGHATVSRVFNWMSRGDEATQRMDGYIDEVRVVNSQLPQAWIWTEYNNQSNTDTFYYVGPQETDSVPSTPREDSAWFY